MMKKKLIYVMTLLFVCTLGVYDVNAKSDLKIRVYSPRAGSKICAKSSALDSGARVFAWNTFDNNNAISSWPGQVMTLDSNGNYCYTVNSGEMFNRIIFNNGDSNNQTIDLSTIRDTGDIIDSLLYVFEEKNGKNKYVGEWYVYDNSSLVSLKSNAETKISNRLKYTKSSYNNFKSMYDSANSAIMYDNPISSTSPYIIHSNDDINGNAVYTSPYIDLYNNFTDSIDDLVERVKLVIDDEISGGVVTASYVDGEADPNNIIHVDSEANLGYDLSSINVHKITGYDGTSPILGDELSSTSDDNYEFSDSDVSGSSGIFVSASFKKKVYKIKFTVDKKGKIIYVKDGNEIDIDIDDILEVEHGTNFLAKIIANDGYEFQSATVNGNDHDVVDNMLKINNINSDQVVEIKFTLKNYTVNIDDVSYTFAHGTTYDEIINILKPSKNGYIFQGLVDKNKNKIDKDYIVKGNDTLYTSFVKADSDDVSNPDTGLQLIKIFGMMSIVIGLLYFNYRRVKGQV